MARKLLFKPDLEARGIKANDSTLWRWEKEGKFPKHFMFGNRRAWHDDVIDTYIDSFAVEPEAAA